MLRAYQVLSSIVFVVSLVLVLQVLSISRFGPFVLHAVGGQNDPPSNYTPPIDSNTDHSRTLHNNSYPAALPTQVNHERATTPSHFTRKIVAIGDLHSDLLRAKDALRISGVMDVRENWSGKVDIFVQTGDTVDRGYDTIELYKLIEKLRSQAARAGGLVLSLMGNHEFLNLQGKWEDVRIAEIATFGSIQNRWNRIIVGDIGKTWAKYYNTAVSPLSHAAISFVHGGLSPTYPNLTPFPSKINKLAQSAMYKLQQSRSDQLTPEEKQLFKGDSPLWYRGWAQDPDAVVCAQVDKVLRETGTRMMVMGHMPQFNGILSRCDGKIFIIDTGMMRHYGGPPSALSIVYTLKPESESAVGANTPVWKERVVVTAIYAGREQVLVNSETRVTGEIKL